MSWNNKQQNESWKEYIRLSQMAQLQGQGQFYRHQMNMASQMAAQSGKQFTYEELVRLQNPEFRKHIESRVVEPKQLGESNAT